MEVENDFSGPVTLAAVNEALLLAGLHQHELAETANRLNAELQTEIADHKLTEESLRASETRFRTLFDLGPVAIYSCDATGLIQDFNRHAAELWGRKPKLNNSADQFCGSCQLNLPDGTVLPHCQCPMADVLSGKIPEARDKEVQIERPDGSRITVIVNIRPLKNECGEIVGAINCFVNITDRKSAEEAVKESDRRKTEFLAMLAHEIRNPLTPIKAAAQLMQMVGLSNPKNIQARNMIERQANRLVRLVDDLLDVSRIENGKVVLQKEHLDVAPVVNNAVDSCAHLIKSRHHGLSVNVQCAPPLFIDADPARVEQAIANLIINAAKYTPPGGSIQISAQREKDMAVIRVRDTGIGIEAHMLNRIFDMFTQVENSLDRNTGGLGLGLKLVKDLIGLHGGTVEAKSEGLSHGSEFIISLPVARENASRVMAAVNDSFVAVEKKTVLVVDDSEDIRDSVSLMLSMAGHRVELAENGEQGLEMALRIRPDVALIDVGIPILNGYEVARRIRAHAGGDKIKLFALTGYAQENDKKLAREAGFDAHLAKPFDIHELLARLNEIGSVQ